MNDEVATMPDRQQIGRDILEKYKEIFLKKSPDFVNFQEAGAEQNQVRSERQFKNSVINEINGWRDEELDDESLGDRVMKELVKEGLIFFQTGGIIKKMPADLLAEFHTTIGQLARLEKETEDAIAEAYESLCAIYEKLRERNQHKTVPLTFGARIQIIFSAMGMSRPNEAAPAQKIYINKVWEQLTGDKIFVNNADFDIRVAYGRFKNVFNQLYEAMTEWKWTPRDWIDIQGFLWVIKNRVEAGDLMAYTGSVNSEIEKESQPMNLILYGPPGTGKTYATAKEAVLRCIGSAPDDRDELMEKYRRLMAEGRIEFVTFHQSMSYEEFVEGRQPTTDSNDDEEATSVGFHLETMPGIFRRIAKRAEASEGRARNDDILSIGDKQVFKMSIGNTNDPDEAHLFEEAIEGGYTILGFDDIDWSPELYAERSAILNKLRDEYPDERIVGNSARVKAPYAFRNRVRLGDIVVVSKGNRLFRAIGEFIGDYEYHPRPEGDYAHRRNVKWLWVDRKGVSAPDICPHGFTQLSIYGFDKNSLNIPVIEWHMNSASKENPTESEPFVLIIDEINRANISSVFGELITLLEPDKRIGKTNEIKVRLPYSGEVFGVPSNLHIIGTMNTADRSIALLDTALRRRFDFQEMMPDPDVLEEVAEKCGIHLPSLLKTINERIEYLYDREHQVGHSYFIGCESKAHVDEVMRRKVIPLLAEYFYEDWAKVAAVLGDLESGDGKIEGCFMNRYDLEVPPGHENEDSHSRFRWEVRSEAEGFDYRKLVSE